MLQSHLIEDDARYAKLARATLSRNSTSNSDLMFDMDEDHADASTPTRSQTPGLTRREHESNNRGSASPSSSVPREESWRDARGKLITPNASSSFTTSSMGTTTPPHPSRLGLEDSPTLTPQLRDDGSPWASSPLQTTKLNMKDIMAQASENKHSNISAAFAAASSPNQGTKSSAFAKMSQKERKRLAQAQKAEFAANAATADHPGSSSDAQPRSSPWRTASAQRAVSLHENLAKSSSDISRNERRQASRSPSLTMRQTLPGNVATIRNKKPDEAITSSSSPAPQRRTVSSPLIQPTSTNTPQSSQTPSLPPSHHISIPSARAGTKANTKTTSKTPPIVPKSIRHIPPVTLPEEFVQASMADILAQQQTEKHALRAATAKRSLQEIQAEQAFQEWWDQEEAATKARMESDAAIAAAAAAATTGASVETRPRGRGGKSRGTARGGGASASARGGKAGGPALSEDAGVEASTRGRGRGVAAVAGDDKGETSHSGRGRGRGHGRGRGQRQRSSVKKTAGDTAPPNAV